MMNSNIFLAQKYIVKADINIIYIANPKITTQDFINMLKASTLGERRPIDNINIMESMLKNCSFLVGAFIQPEKETYKIEPLTEVESLAKLKLVGIARGLTDFIYSCYLSDLAADSNYQKLGIGKDLLYYSKIC